MKEFQCPNPDAQVASIVVGVFVDAFGAYRARGEKILARHFGVDSVELGPDKYYPLRAYLEAHAEIQTQFGPSYIRTMGTIIYSKIEEFAGNFEDFHTAMAASTEIYHSVHPNHQDQIGGYRWTKTSETSGVLFADNCYCCALDEGLINGIAKAFDMTVRTRHAEGKPCRATGGESCTYIVEW